MDDLRKQQQLLATSKTLMTTVSYGLSVGKESITNVDVGDVVMVLWKPTKETFKATIEKRHNDGCVDVFYEADSSEEKRISCTRITSVLYRAPRVVHVAPAPARAPLESSAIAASDDDGEYLSLFGSGKPTSKKRARAKKSSSANGKAPQPATAYTVFVSLTLPKLKGVSSNPMVQVGAAWQELKKTALAAPDGEAAAQLKGFVVSASAINKALRIAQQKAAGQETDGAVDAGALPARTGDLISVWWPKQQQWYRGTVDKIADGSGRNGDPASATTLVAYNDGDKRWHNLRQFQWRYEAPGGASPPPPPPLPSPCVKADTVGADDYGFEDADADEIGDDAELEASGPDGSNGESDDSEEGDDTHARGHPTHEVAGCDSAHVGEWAGAWEQCWIDRRWTEGGVEFCDLTVIDDESGEHVEVPKILLKWVRALPLSDSASSRSTAADSAAEASSATAGDGGSSAAAAEAASLSAARAPPTKQVHIDPRSVAAAFARSQLALSLSAAWKVRAAASDAASAAREATETKEGGEWLAAEVADGRRYFYNSETKESVRHPPVRYVSLRDVAARKAERYSRRNAAVALLNAPLDAAAGATADAGVGAAAVADAEMIASAAAAAAAAPPLQEAEEERCPQPNQRALVARLMPLPFARAIVPHHRALFGQLAPSICVPLRLPRRTPIATDAALLHHARRANARRTRALDEFPTHALVSYDFEGLEWESG